MWHHGNGHIGGPEQRKRGHLDGLRHSLRIWTQFSKSLSFSNLFFFPLKSEWPLLYHERQPTKIFLLQGELMAISWSVTELMQILKLNIHDIQLWNDYLKSNTLFHHISALCSSFSRKVTLLINMYDMLTTTTSYLLLVLVFRFLFFLCIQFCDFFQLCLSKFFISLENKVQQPWINFEKVKLKRSSKQEKKHQKNVLCAENYANVSMSVEFIY